MEKEIKINVVNSLDDYQKVVAIRSIVFVGEQKLPYSVEFGTNELCCTYILATVNGEPAGTVRIHQFKEFAKLERMAVLAEYRRTPLAEQIRQKALDICSAKGITKIYGLCRRELLPHWSKFGYHPVEGAPGIKRSNMDLVPILVDIQEAKDIIKFTDHPDLFMDQEGEWRDNCMYFQQPFNVNDQTAVIIRKRNELRQQRKSSEY